MAKRLKNSLKLKKIKKWNFFFVFFGKMKIMENTEKIGIHWKKKFFSGFYAWKKWKMSTKHWKLLLIALFHWKPFFCRWLKSWKMKNTEN